MGNGARLAINSLPEHIAREFFNKQYSIDDLIDDSANMTYHVIVELNDNDDLENIAMKGIHEAGLKMSSLASTVTANADTNNDGIPDTLYPQMLIQLDHLWYNRWLKRGLSLLLEYILAFGNGVDLIYRRIENPKIRLNIAGIIIATDIRATPYIWKNMIKTDVSYDATRLMVAASLFFYTVEESSPIVAFDSAVIMTEMYGIVKHPSGDKIAGGLSYTGRVCFRNHNGKRKEGVMVINDYGSLTGIPIAVHELAHLLGAQHAADRSNTQCTSLNDGLVKHSTNPNKITSCMLEDIRAEFNHGALDCLKNVPQMIGTKLPGLMPGITTNMVEQCLGVGYQRPCYPNGVGGILIKVNEIHKDYVDACDNLWCSSKRRDNDTCKAMNYPPPAGMMCLKEDSTEYGVCIKNRCVGV